MPPASSARLKHSATKRRNTRQLPVVFFRSGVPPGRWGQRVDLSVQPGPGISPVPLGLPQRDSKDLGRFRHGEAGEEAESDQLGGQGIGRFEAVQGLVQSKQLLVRSLGGRKGFVEVHAPTVAAVLRPTLAAGFDEDTSHGLGRGGEEVTAAVPSAVPCRCPPGADRLRGPVPSPAASDRASPEPVAEPPVCAARCRPAATAARRRARRPVRWRTGCA